MSEITIDSFDERIETVDIEEVENLQSLYGSECLYITETEIDELRQGKVLYIDDGEYTHFVALKRSDEG